MFNIEAAGLTIRIHNRYDWIRRMCGDYLVGDDQCPDLEIGPVSDELLSRRWVIRRCPDREVTDEGVKEFDMMSLYCLYPKLPAHQAFWIHSVAIDMDGAGYALTATSGYGKTTQGRHWVQHYAGRAQIINGDEPIVRRCGGEYWIYGTPFCGEEGYQVNRGVPLHGLCWLEHGEANHIERVDPVMAYALFVRDYQHMGSMTPDNREQYMELLEDFFTKVPAYLWTCNLDQDASRTAYEGMRAGWEAFRSHT